MNIPFINFGLTGKEWADDTVVMTWASIRDWDNAGMNESFTCIATYNHNQEFAEDVTVQNFYGSKSFSADNVRNSKPRELNSGDLQEEGPWELDTVTP